MLANKLQQHLRCPAPQGRRGGRLAITRAAEPFNESASTVKRLISRDRKEFLGNTDILDKYTTEFGEGSSRAEESSAPQSPFGATLSSDNPFGPASTSSPFGQGAAAAQPFRRQNSAIEPAGLRPDMGPDPIQKEKAFNLFESITLTQILIVLSFTLIIGLMVSTFFFVYNVGGVRLNGI